MKTMINDDDEPESLSELIHKLLKTLEDKQKPCSCDCPACRNSCYYRR